MPWFKVDDQFDANKKVKSIPRRNRAKALGLWVQAGAWAARELTDGFIPNYMIEDFAVTMKIAEELVTAELWEKAENGFNFTNWSEFQPTSKEVREKRDSERKRKAEWREAKKERGQNSATSTNDEMSQRDNLVTDSGTHAGLTNSSALPDPTRPDPTRITTDVVIEEGTQADVEPEKPKRANAHLLPENWQPTDKVKQDLAAQFPTYDLERILRRFHDYWHSQPVGKARKRDWNRTFRNWVDAETRPPLISERTQPTAPGRLSNAEVARQLQERNAQDHAQQREMSNAEALEEWMQNQKAIGF